MSYGPPPSDSDEDDYDGFMFSTDYDNYGNRRQSPIPIGPPNTNTLLSRKKDLQQKIEKYISTDDISGLHNLTNSDPSININETLSDYKWTPLFIACQERKVRIVKYLLFDLNADPNVHMDMWTPLMVVCNGYKSYLFDSVFNSSEDSEVLEIVEMLLSRNAVINMHNMMGQTALMFAAENGYNSVVKFLIKKSVAIEAVDNEGKTALMYAVKANQYEVTKTLIKSGALTSSSDRYNNTPKSLAQENGHEDIERLFPQDKQIPDVPYEYTFYNTYKDYLPLAYHNQERALYSPDVLHIVRGMKSKVVEYKLYEARISILDLLTANNVRLHEIGVDFPFQRKRILLGILKFHGQEWLNTSLNIPKRINTTSECFQLYADCLRSLTIIKCSMRFIKDFEIFCKSSDTDTMNQYRKEIHHHFSQIQGKASKLLGTMRTIEHLFELPPPLHRNENIKNEALNVKDTFRMKFYRTFTFAVFGFGISFLIRETIRK